MRSRLRKLRETVREILDREARVRDLVKATLPLWISTVAGVIAAIVGFAWYLDQREGDAHRSCVRGRSDIAEFVHRLAEMDDDDDDEDDAQQRIVLERLLDDFVADCP